MSEWGRTQVDSFYDPNASGIELEVSELSSGISPRDMRPRAMPFDTDQATQVRSCSGVLIWLYSHMSSSAT